MKKILMLTFLLFLNACALDTIKVHGNMINDEDLSYVEEGQTSKNDLIMMFGQPTSKASFDKDIWYYVGQSVEYHSFMKPKITDRKVVEVSFDNEGLVSSVSDYGLEDGVALNPSSDKTRSLGSEKNALQQVLGNIGKFNSPVNKF